MPKRGEKHSEEAKEKIRNARSKQIHPRLACRGIVHADLSAALAAGLKWCSGNCKSFRPIEEFSTRATQCRKCAAESVGQVRKQWSEDDRREMADRIKSWRVGNPGYEKRFRLLYKYGVTPEWYEAKLAEQQGICGLCDSAIGHKAAKFLFVDHHHGTGRVRGLLCAKCNTALERLDSVPGWIQRAADYIAHYSE